MYWHVPDLFNPNNFRGSRKTSWSAAAPSTCCACRRASPSRQSKGLRRIVSPYDRESGRAQQFQHTSSRPAAGLACARFGGIGDNLMACSSAVQALKRKGLKVEVITSHDCAWQVFLHNPHIDKLSVKTKSEIPPDADGLAEVDAWTRRRVRCVRASFAYLRRAWRSFLP